MTNKELKEILTSYEETKEAYAFYSKIAHGEEPNGTAALRAETTYKTMRKYEELLEKLFSFISNPTHKDMLTDYYINGLLWREISNKYHYSEQSLYNTKRRALTEIVKRTS